MHKDKAVVVIFSSFEAEYKLALGFIFGSIGIHEKIIKKLFAFLVGLTSNLSSFILGKMQVAVD